MSMTCKHCGTTVEGNNYAMAAHRRHHCTAGTGKNGVAHTPPHARNGFDPVAVIESLNSGVIRSEIEGTNRRLVALNALLAVAEANEKPAAEMELAAVAN